MSEKRFVYGILNGSRQAQKRFVYGILNGSRQAHIKDCHTCKSATIDVYDDDFKYFVDLLNELAEENEQLKKENRMLKKDLNKLYNLLMDKGMSHNELQDVLWGIDDE